MFGKKKDKDQDTPGLPDETLQDKSKFIVLGFGIFCFSVILVLGLEIYTGIKLSSQNKVIGKTGNLNEETKKILQQMSIKGKESRKQEYFFAKELEKLMSPQEFQDFKNSISPIASKYAVSVDELKEGKISGVGKNYQINRIEYLVSSTYANYVEFRKELSNTSFKINFEKEIIKRERATNNIILVEGTVYAYVADKKEKTLKKLKPSIDKHQKIIDKENKKKAKKSGEKKGDKSKSKLDNLLDNKKN